MEFGSSVSQVTTSNVGGATGTQSYSHPVLLMNSAVSFSSVGGAIVFGGAVDSGGGTHTALTVNASGGGVTFGNNFGVTASLSSFTASGTAVTLNGVDYKTDGTQSYGGAVLLGSDATLTRTGSGAATRTTTTGTT